MVRRSVSSALYLSSLFNFVCMYGDGIYPATIVVCFPSAQLVCNINILHRSIDYQMHFENRNIRFDRFFRLIYILTYTYNVGTICFMAFSRDRVVSRKMFFFRHVLSLLQYNIFIESFVIDRTVTNRIESLAQ